MRLRIKRFTQLLCPPMTQRDYAPPDDYDDVPVDYKVSDAESVDPYESYNAVLHTTAGSGHLHTKCHDFIFYIVPLLYGWSGNKES